MSHQPSQKITLRAHCIALGPPVPSTGLPRSASGVDPILPNEPLRTLELRNPPRFTRLVRLKISQRAWIRDPLVSLNSLTKFMSNCANVGRRPEPFPQVPSRPAAGVANACAALVIADREVFRSG